MKMQWKHTRSSGMHKSGPPSWSSGPAWTPGVGQAHHRIGAVHQFEPGDQRPLCKKHNGCEGNMGELRKEAGRGGTHANSGRTILLEERVGEVKEQEALVRLRGASAVLHHKKSIREGAHAGVEDLDGVRARVWPFLSLFPTTGPHPTLCRHRFHALQPQRHARPPSCSSLKLPR